MCTGKCARCIGLSLIPLSLVCIVANALLLVPNGQTTWTDHLSLQVWLMAGFIGGGLLVRRLVWEPRHKGWLPRTRGSEQGEAGGRRDAGKAGYLGGYGKGLEGEPEWAHLPWQVEHPADGPGRDPQSWAESVRGARRQTAALSAPEHVLRASLRPH